MQLKSCRANKDYDMYLFNLIQYHLNLIRMDKQEKLYYKNKVSDIISSYQKQKEEQEKQKILIKKQIMLSIINNRRKSEIETIPKQKSQASKQEKTEKTNLSEQALLDLNIQDNKFSQKSNIYQPQLNVDTKYQSQLNKKPEHLQDITFNAKKRNRSLQQEPSFKESYLNLLRERRQKQQEQEYKNMKASNKKYSQQAEQQQNHPQIHKSLYRSSNEDQEDQHSKVQLHQKEQRSYPHFNKYSQLKESNSYVKSKTEISDRYKEQEDYRSQKSEEQYQQKRQEEQPKGVFLTMMGESQSMVADQPPKNIAFQIKMDKSVNPSDFQELKKQKIKQIERKRQQRIQQFRRNQSQKKVQMPKGKNSYSKRPQKQQFEQSDIPPPRSTTVQRKNHEKNATKNDGREKQAIRSNLIPLESHESQYNVKPKNVKPPSNSNSYYNEAEPKPPTSYKHIHANNYEQKQLKPKSPFKTPKSIVSQNNRGKSNNKNTNIFTAQGEQPRQKSNTKYVQPKIEPKDRKNSFTRQSNKKLMINAITHVIFPGQLNRKERQRLIDIIEASQYQFFIFLFKEYSRKMIKGIYVFDSSQVYLRKIYGEKSPSEITAEMVQQFYRFDSGSREFKKVDGCKSFSLSIHAIDLRK